MTLQDIKLAGHEWLREKFGEAGAEEHKRVLYILLTCAYAEGGAAMKEKAMAITKFAHRNMEDLRVDTALTSELVKKI
jgi:hypothetical protein